MNEDKLERLRQLMPVEATETSTADFLLTHVPFKNLYLDDHTYISEKSLLDGYVLKNMDSHKFIMVQGSNGTGKSHLIRWLYECYRNVVDSDKEQIMFISRSHNTLQDAMEQLLKSDIFPNDIRENELRVLKLGGSKNTGDELKRVIGFNFTLELERNKDSISSLNKRQIDQLKDYLMNEYILSTFLMVPEGPLEKIRRKIETVDDEVQYGNQDIFRPEDFAITKKQVSVGLMRGEQQASLRVTKLATDLSDTMKGPGLRQQVADCLNSCVSNVIERSAQLKTSDFKQVFISLREYLRKEGKSLTLFIEDINAFTGIDKALMEVLITNHQAMGNESCCRLISVVGSTTDFFRNNINDSIKDRITTNVIIRDTSSKESILGTAESRIRFAAAYLNAFHLTDHELDKWRSEGMNTENIPIAAAEHIFSEADVDGNKVDLFPFNVNALEVFFSLMPEHERSPRLFLRNVLGNVLRVYYGDSQHFFSMENRFINKSVPALRPWKNPSYEGANRKLGDRAAERDLLLRMWGDATPEVVGNCMGGLTSEVFRAFGIPLTVSLDDEANLKQKAPNPIAISTIVLGRTERKTETISETSEEKVIKKEIVLDKNIDEQEAIIRDWYAGNDRGHAAYRKIREAFQDFILDSVDWTLHEIPIVLVERCIKGTEFVLESGINSRRDKEMFLIEKDESSRNMLTGVVHWRYAGNRSWHFEGASDYYIDAFVWLDSHMGEILEHATRCGMSVKEVYAYYVAGAYSVKSLFEPVYATDGDLLKAAEEIFGSQPSSQVTEGCGPSWKSLEERVVKKNRNMDTVFTNALLLFQMGVGGGYKEDTEYVVYDVMKVIEAMHMLKENDWDIRRIDVPENIVAYSQPGFCEVAPVALLTIKEDLDKAIEESQVKVDGFMHHMNEWLADEVNLETIKSLLEEVRGFSNFLLNRMNKNNDDSAFRILYTMKPELICEAYAGYKENKNSRNPILRKIMNNDMSSINRYYEALLAFDKFLSKYEDEYSVNIPIEDNQDNEKFLAEVKELSKEIAGILKRYEGVI